MKNKDNHGVNKVKLLIYICIIGILMSVLVWNLTDKYRTKKMYCYFENDIFDGELPRNEVINIVIKTTDMDRIDFNQFSTMDTVNYECSKDPELLAYEDSYLAQNGPLYFSSYPLKLFASTDIDGEVCVRYVITYLDENNPLIEYYETMFLQEKFNDSESWSKRFWECVG